MLHEEILELLKKRMKADVDGSDYINPNFLQMVTGAIYNYYDEEDDEVDAWILAMFEM